MDSNHHRHQETTTTSKGKKNKIKSEGKTSRCPHTLIDSWSLGSAAQTLHRSDVGQTWRQSSWKQKDPPDDRGRQSPDPKQWQQQTHGEKKKSYLRWWQRVRDIRDVRPTTVRALWWRIVYWSGSLCLCEWFDIHAAFTSSWWEGKLLFLAHLLLAVCVCVCLFHTHTHTQGVHK